jgi:hypothetical protein
VDGKNRVSTEAQPDHRNNFQLTATKLLLADSHVGWNDSKPNKRVENASAHASLLSSLLSLDIISSGATHQYEGALDAFHAGLSVSGLRSFIFVLEVQYCLFAGMFCVENVQQMVRLRSSLTLCLQST